MKDDFPNIKQYDELKAKHPDALILMRRNDNYESIRADADKVSKICGIDTFERVKSDTNESVKMTSFAAPALDTFLPKLIRADQRVAICEALEEPRKEIHREAEQTERKTGMRI
jgi:DNA mismatch repair ATPase MutS